jgi:hypothetical protein
VWPAKVDLPMTMRLAHLLWVSGVALAAGASLPASSYANAADLGCQCCDKSTQLSFMTLSTGAIWFLENHEVTVPVMFAHDDQQQIQAFQPE